MWWKKQNYEFGYVSYLIDSTEVLVGQRLDKCGIELELFESINGFLSVTDSFIHYPPDSNAHWFPWKESENFPDTVLFGSLKILNQWIKEDKLKKIYIHCDLGSHRAPSVLGAFLFAYYSKKESLDIIKKALFFNNQITNYKNINTGENNADPLYYINEKIKINPKLSYLIKAIVSEKEHSLEDIVDVKLNLYLPENLLPAPILLDRQNSMENNAFYSIAREELKDSGYLFEDNNDSVFIATKDGIEYKVFIVNEKNEKPHNGLISLALSNKKMVLIVTQDGNKQIPIMKGFKSSLTKLKSVQVAQIYE